MRSTPAAGFFFLRWHLDAVVQTVAHQVRSGPASIRHACRSPRLRRQVPAVRSCLAAGNVAHHPPQLLEEPLAGLHAQPHHRILQVIAGHVRLTGDSATCSRSLFPKLLTPEVAAGTQRRPSWPTWFITASRRLAASARRWVRPCHGREPARSLRGAGTATGSSRRSLATAGEPGKAEAAGTLSQKQRLLCPRDLGG